MTREALGFGPFLASLERRLDELTAGQLRRVLLEHGARLPAGERVGFLHLFDTPAAATGHDDPGLLDDVESFIASIASGAYAEGYGYDPDYGEYRTFGDESWTIEMGDRPRAVAGRRRLRSRPSPSARLTHFQQPD